MIALITNDPTQWKLIAIFLTLIWISLSLWIQGLRSVRIQSQLQALETASAKTGRTTPAESGKVKIVN